MAKALYLFTWECGRMGTLDGMFVADETNVAALIGKEIYFGEALGKHSDIVGNLHETDVKLISKDQDLITKMVAVCGGRNTLCGYNPFDFYMLDDEEDE